MAARKEDAERVDQPQKRDITQILETFTDAQLGHQESELRGRGVGIGTVEPHERRIDTLEKVREHIAATLERIGQDPLKEDELPFLPRSGHTLNQLVIQAELIDAMGPTHTFEPDDNKIMEDPQTHAITSVVQYMKFEGVNDIVGNSGVWEIALRRTSQIGSEINAAVPRSVAGETTLPSYSQTELIFRKKQPKLPPTQTIANFGS
ncbi:MAG TPA: hypothetical protein VLF93_06995 [Candidatus Saccharimonadales bacterium]|nr:hypothetical protein [Candidatus Saccharimonadales bacterium]